MSTMAQRASTFLTAWGVKTTFPDPTRDGVQVRNSGGPNGNRATVAVGYDGSPRDTALAAENVRVILAISPWTLDPQPHISLDGTYVQFSLTGFKAKEDTLPTYRPKRILAWGDHLTRVHREGTTGTTAQVTRALETAGLITPATDGDRSWELTPLGRDLMAATRLRKGMMPNPDDGDDQI